MANKPIREYHAKKLLFKYFPKDLGSFDYTEEYETEYSGILVTPDTNLDELDLSSVNDASPAGRQGGKLVVKPDQLFGKRGKNGLIYIAENKNDAKNWIKEKMNTEVIVKKNDQDEGIKGKLTHFLVEPYVEHEKEYYLAIKTQRDHDLVMFSEQGGIDIEESWESVVEIKIPVETGPNVLWEGKMMRILSQSDRLAKDHYQFVASVYNIFNMLNFAYLELNPYVVTNNGEFKILDAVAQLDSTASYDMSEMWKIDNKNPEDVIEFPKQFGTDESKYEKIIEEIDEKSGASLKFSLLNKDGRIWQMIGGGGASVIFADTVADLGYVNELGNYGEYSGNPNDEETEGYLNALLGAMFESKGENKVLILGGGIANFSDVAKAFTGIIKSLEKNKEELVRQGIKIFVRRGGPNYKIALKKIKNFLDNFGIENEVHGPEMHMTRVVKLALSDE